MLLFVAFELWLSKRPHQQAQHPARITELASICADQLQELQFEGLLGSSLELKDTGAGWC